jgi:hypothetical protein
MGLAHLANMSYIPYPFSIPTPCGSDSETQDDRFLLSQPRERQMPATGVRQMPEPGRSQMPALGESQGPATVESQALISGESQMPHDGDFMTLGPDQSPPDSPHDMLSDDDQ